MNIYEFHNNPSILKGYDQRNSIVPKLVYDNIIANEHQLKGSDDEEAIIATSPTYSYLYAREVLKGPFVIGEKAISLNARRSYRYAKDVLGHRFLLGEQAILNDPVVSIQYAKDVLKSRIVEIEPLIISKFGKSSLEEMTEFDKIYLQTYFRVVPVDERDAFSKLLPLHLVELYDEFDT